MPLYWGYASEDVVIPDGIPAIVPLDLFKRVQEKPAKTEKLPQEPGQRKTICCPPNIPQSLRNIYERRMRPFLYIIQQALPFETACFFWTFLRPFCGLKAEELVPCE